MKYYLYAEAPNLNLVKKNGGNFQHARTRPESLND